MMRVVVIAALLCAIVGVCGLSAPPFSSVGTVAGKTVLWFAGTEVTMAFEGTMQIIGDLEIAGAPVGFTAAGPIRGEGEGDTMTLTGMLWTTFIAEGTLETGEPIVIRGGASASGEDLVLTAEASGSGGGAFVASIEVGDGMLRVSGEVAGSVGGTFVPPDDPYTMQLDAQATLEMNAAAIAPLGDIHFETQTPSSVWAIDFAGWPEEILEDLMQLVGGTEEDE